MQRYEITGMSCAACASHVEKAVAAVPGVASVAVSLLTNSMQVDYAPDADPDATARRILRAVDAAGRDVLLFENEWSIRLALENNPGLSLAETASRAQSPEGR